MKITIKISGENGEGKSSTKDYLVDCLYKYGKIQGVVETKHRPKIDGTHVETTTLEFLTRREKPWRLR